MNSEELKEVSFIDTHLSEAEQYKILLLINRDKNSAERFYELLKKGFNLKHRKENSGHYIIAVTIRGIKPSFAALTQETEKQNPKLSWLDDSLITHVTCGYRDKNGTLQGAGNALPLRPKFLDN